MYGYILGGGILLGYQSDSSVVELINAEAKVKDTYDYNDNPIATVPNESLFLQLRD